jgi:hypothetical protein
MDPAEPVAGPWGRRRPAGAAERLGEQAGEQEAAAEGRAGRGLGRAFPP